MKESRVTVLDGRGDSIVTLLLRISEAVGTWQYSVAGSSPIPVALRVSRSELLP